MPIDTNDGWINLFDKNLTVSNRNISVYPDTDPSLSWADDSTQINPYFTISLQTKLYGEVWQPRLFDALPNFELSLQTTFTIKDLYKK